LSMKTSTLSTNRARLFASLVITCFAISPVAQAVVPPPDGGYPGGNTAVGQNALLSLTTGIYNTAVGFLSLESNMTNNFNTAIGAGALLANTADNNTVTGAGALFSHTTGNSNTANGAFALFSDTTGQVNTAIGANALFSNTTGNFNTATGFSALANNTTGDDNTANGAQALQSNTTGNDNTANGATALISNTTGINNTAVGRSALSNNTTGSFNIALGYLAGVNTTTGNSNVYIGSVGQAAESAAIRIGSGIIHARAFIAGIRGVTTGFADAVPVLIDSVGQLGTISSSRRFKNEIKLMDKTSEAILTLKPVTFHYKNDKTHTPQFGLIAEDVAEVNPDLVVRDKNGEIYTVRYDAVNAMLLNEFLKEHRKNEEQEASIARLKEQIEALTAGLQQVSAQLAAASPSHGGLEASQSTPHLVLKDR
jgi:hypothetical protein